jgi:hypothetical protein
MQFLHYEIDAHAGTVVRVALRGSECNVMLMDTNNFYRYRSGDTFHYVGGHFQCSPANLSVPDNGHWHVVVDTGGYPGRVTASVTVHN